MPERDRNESEAVARTSRNGGRVTEVDEGRDLFSDGLHRGADPDDRFSDVDEGPPGAELHRFRSKTAWERERPMRVRFP